MSKVKRSSKVTIQNIWGVDSTSSSKSYKIRFRNAESSDGWATAFIPKSDAVHVDSTTKRNMYNVVADNEDVKVRIRTKTSDGHREKEVPIRGKIGGEPGFKELYENSRFLVKEDKANKALETSTEATREMPEVAERGPFDDPEDPFTF